MSIALKSPFHVNPEARPSPFDVARMVAAEARDMVAFWELYEKHGVKRDDDGVLRDYRAFVIFSRPNTYKGPPADPRVVYATFR